MRLCTIGQTQIRVSIGVLVLLLFAAATQALGTLLCSLWALALHEICHAMTASALGYTCESFELLPFGAAMRIRGYVEPAAMMAIALSGPVGSLMAAMACTLAMRFFPELAAMLEPLVRINLLLALFNLLPAQPLDGGRILTAMLQRVISARKAAAVGIWLGVALGGVLVGACVWIGISAAFNPTLLAAGGLLFAYALREWRAKPLAAINVMHRKGTRLRREGALHTRVLAVDAELSAHDALQLLAPGGYNLLMVVDERLCLLGRLGEGELMEAMLEYGEDVTIKKVLGRQ